MRYTDGPSAPNTSIITPQFRHRQAAELHERAVKHHRHAALLHDAGDERQADTHANIATQACSVGAGDGCDGIEKIPPAREGWGEKQGFEFNLARRRDPQSH